ncbi:MAG TPA: heterodisulfide reductase-related iron-sulfur binding cluster [Methanomassiliicoccales archaeon]|nr:heterodisulfide reductase-related iron-sulfur binding cluster [Methanomassiliicoccales archaeon]
MTTDQCIKCGGCEQSCPVVCVEGIQSFSGPRTLAVDGPRFSVEINRLRDHIMKCTTCWKCEEVCPSRIDLPQAILEIRKVMFDPLKMLPGHRRIVENVDRFRMSIEPEGGAPPAPAGERGEVMYFPGCISRERIPSIYRGTVSTLEKVGTDFGVPKGWVCCGAPLEKVGDRDRMESLVEENLRTFEGFETIVTSCPGCTTQLFNHYGVEPLHTIEYLYESVGLNKLSFRHAGDIKVAFHQPCHLSRTIGRHAMDYALALLQEVPGLEVLELENADMCCGGGGGVVAGHPDVALDLANEKMSSFSDSGADLLLAPCPFCVLNLERAGGSNVREFVTFLEAFLE